MRHAIPANILPLTSANLLLTVAVALNTLTV